MQNQEAYANARRISSHPASHPLYSRIESPTRVHQIIIAAAYAEAYTVLGRGRSQRIRRNAISLQSVLMAESNPYRWSQIHGSYPMRDEQRQALDDLVEAGFFTLTMECNTGWFPLGIIRMND